MKALNIWAVGFASVSASGISAAQGGSMMDSWMGNHGHWMSGYAGGIWLPVIVCVAVVAGLIWVIQKRK